MKGFIANYVEDDIWFPELKKALGIDCSQLSSEHDSIVEQMENYKSLVALLVKKEDISKNLQLFVNCVHSLNADLFAHLKGEEDLVREPLKSLPIEYQKELSKSLN